jgi:zona occludens toxin (predicted ATPase)
LCQKDKEELEDTKEVIRIHKSINQRRTHNTMAERTKKSWKTPKRDYLFGIFQLFFILLAIMLSVLLSFMDSDYLFGIFQLFFILLAIMLSVLL